MCTFGPTLGPIYPRKETENEKSNYFRGKSLSIGLSKYPKIKALSGPNFELKYNYFLQIRETFRFL